MKRNEGQGKVVVKATVGGGGGSRACGWMLQDRKVWIQGQPNSYVRQENFGSWGGRMGGMWVSGKDVKLYDVEIIEFCVLTLY